MASAVAACGGDGATGGAGGGGTGGEPPVEVAACDPGVTSGTPAFVRQSEAWGLTGQAVTGIITTAGDLDGDGYPDLIVNDAHSGERRVIGVDPPPYRVLMNRPTGDGTARTFVDVTIESGFALPADGSTTTYRNAQLSLLGDLDNDGDLDVFSGTYTDPAAVGANLSPGQLDRHQVLLNDGTGHFTAAPASDLQTLLPEPLGGASLVDFDRDGLLDLFLVDWFGPNYSNTSPRLLKGRGDGTFEDVSSTAGLKAAEHRRAGFGATVCDLDDDGWPELILSAYGRQPNVIFRQDGASFFSDVALTAGYAYDANQTYGDNQFFQCYCTVHPDARECEYAATPAVVCPTPADANWSPTLSTKPEALGGNTFTTVCSDITGDGTLDLYNAEIKHWWAGEGSDQSELLVGTPGAIAFERPDREALGLSWPHPSVDWDEGGLYAAAVDLDLDGRQDILVGATDYYDQYGMIYHQLPDGRFEEVAKPWGFDHACASGPTVADFDRDGDLDIVVGSSRMREWCAAAWATPEVHLYESDAAGKGAWVGVRLAGDGVTANRSAIGARVTVDTGVRRLVQEVSGGYGHGATQHDLVLFFGVGACGVLPAIEVTWPDAARTVERFEAVETGRVVDLVQGTAAAGAP